MGYDHKVLDSLKDAVGSVIVDRNRTPEATPLFSYLKSESVVDSCLHMMSMYLLPHYFLSLGHEKWDFLGCHITSIELKE